MPVRDFIELFQSTPPARGATILKEEYINDLAISIHAPREGGDRHSSATSLFSSIFQSTPPARGATYTSPLRPLGRNISIHAPREGGDGYSAHCRVLSMISIHAPREGGDAGNWAAKWEQSLFQSTPPARGATFRCLRTAPATRLFQSTPPARGATGLSSSPFTPTPDFNPRPPRGGRL